MGYSITDDVIQAVHLLFYTASPNKQRKAEKKLREEHPLNEGWFLPSDLARDVKTPVGATIEHACHKNSTTRLLERLKPLRLIEHSKDNRFIRLRRDPEGVALVARFVDGVNFYYRQKKRKDAPIWIDYYQHYVPKVSKSHGEGVTEAHFLQLKKAYAVYTLTYNTVVPEARDRLKKEKIAYAAKYAPEMIPYHMLVDIEEAPEAFRVSPLETVLKQNTTHKKMEAYCKKPRKKKI